MRDLRVARGWDRPRMARELRAVADEPVAEHHALVRMIRTWEDGSHRLSERYLLLYRRVFPGWRVNGTVLHDPDLGAVLERARRIPGPVEIDAMEAAAARDERSAALFARIRDMERQLGALREAAEELFGAGDE